MKDSVCDEPALSVSDLHALLAREISAGGGGKPVLVEGPLTLFEAAGFISEPGRCWLRTSWCAIHAKAVPARQD
ncbi:hypothetical protein IT575_01360 [bacterium]|nr:hypothetical protein [bacterium]